jgi:ABC-type uncharacterized transport system permease subunit
MAPRKIKTSAYSDEVRFRPFLLFCLVFEIVPVLFLIQGRFVEKTTSELTFSHYLQLQLTGTNTCRIWN